ncbi:acyl-CoA dehydrogenase C-terminal domain-containing protein [Rhodoferax sp. AJA081-3]|uniref:acyl-CoA dehydrogenase C-terminal domain-containing protein n=1 Tax=Rhodoferax sp. AJA081-3 TaxID=2752316 RepID=UPI001ADFBCC3|nr:acyl-CoA dehydrogenase C-terminal domain-containing protein [Rhodoferax sp. AJA081-3]QTN28919.1 acyl-CoA dehydrogenase C-terminal domain-containing protein [Rhodoferax sp. AJA081-3]
MLQYKAPLRDMRFLINEVLDYPQHYGTLSNGADATPEMVDAILEGAATLCEEVLAPLNASGDKEGCQLNDGVVTTPKGFKEAYAEFIAGGWQGLSFPVEYGGQGLPMSLNLMKSEMMGAANWSFNMYPGLSIGCINTLLQYGTDAIKTVYLPRLVAGEWTGTMCLTEPQCGTDLAQVKTRAEPQADGTYALTGTKIFISSGDHDLAKNIVHIVLARLPGAPEGTRGISLFVVPKFAVAADGTVGDRNGVNTGSLEHKMGIAANATAVLNFDGAIGTLIGEPNKGLEAMFTFMNTARIGTAIQGVAHAELSFQGALPYAQERRSMRALSGKKEPEQVADALIWHPDVRRMLLTQKAIAEGGRAMVYGASKIADKMFNAVTEGDQAKYKKYDDELGFYTPILKGFLTEMGLEAANLGIQVFGGHGYIGEHGMEQIARDARISTLYEGTTGIQALDLLGRKVLLNTKGKCVRDFSATMLRLIKPYSLQRTPMGQMMRTLARRTAQWNVLTTLIMLRASKDREQVGSSSVDYLMYSGFVMMAYFWALQASKAAELLASGKGKESNDFYTAKIQTAEFYFARLLPRADGHYSAALAPTSAVMQMPQELFQMA